MKKYRIGYTQGVFDMFHIGHLNLIQRAKEQCDYLVVAVNSDELVKSYKNKEPVINQADRMRIVESVRYVDCVILADTLDKEKMYAKKNFDAIFIGDDWKEHPRWVETETVMKKYGVDVVYTTYTQGISSTQLRDMKK